MSKAITLVRHNKTGKVYVVDGFVTNCTNAQDGQDMVMYSRDGATYVREHTEFMEKFTVIDWENDNVSGH